MKTKLACLFLTAAATALLAQVPQPAPPSPGKGRAISVPVRTFTPEAPSNVSTVTNTASGAPTRPPRTSAPELLPALPLPTGTTPSAPSAQRPLPAPAVALPSNTLTLPGGPSAPRTAGTNAMGLPAAGGKEDEDGPRFSPDQSLDPAVTQLQAAPLDQVLELYSQLTGRTILKSSSLPATTITLKVQSKLTVKETLQALDSVLSLNGIAVIPTGEKFLTVVLSTQADKEGAAFNQMSAKELPEAGQYITKVVQVKNAKPTEILPALSPFMKSGTGILAIDATSMLVLRDSAINIKRVLEVLEKIDVAVPTEEQFKVIPINYALAADVAQVLGSLTSGGSSGTGSTGSSRTSGRSSGRGTSPFGGNTGVSGSGVGTMGGATPFGGQPGTNPGIPGAAQPGTAQTQFQQRLNQIVSNIAGGRAGGAPLLGEAKIIPYDRSNSLLVLANEKELAMLEKLLKQIDVPQQQVLIEALIFETDIGNSRDVSFGVGQKTAQPGANFSGKGGINSIFTFSTNATALVGPATGGFGYLAQIGNNWGAAISLIERDSNSEILSRPRIQTSHAESASIFSGGTTPYVTGTTFGVGVGSQNQIQQLQIGISMQVLPLITADGLVVLDINQTIESEGGSVKIDANLEVPKTVRHQAQAKVAVKDGETIMLGGLIRTKRTKSVSGVPGLKDIPLLGALFRSTSENPTRVELIVLIRPTVLPTPQSASLAAQAERQRSTTIRGVEQMVKEREIKQNKRIEDEEIDAMRKLMKKYPNGQVPTPDSPLGAPVAPPVEKKPSTDFLDIPKTGTP